VAAIGVEIDAISRAMNSAIIVVAIASVTIAPPLFNLLVPKKAEKRRRVVIIGSPPHARLLAQRLKTHDEEVVIVTANQDFISHASELGFKVEEVPEKDYVQAIERIKPDEVGSLVSMLDDEETTLKITSKARNLGIENVIAYVKNPDFVEQLKREGIHGVEPGLSLVVALEAMIRHPLAFELLVETRQERDVIAVKLNNPTLENKSLNQIKLSGDSLVLVIDRDREIIVPRGYTRLKQGDRLTLIGSRSDLKSASEFLSSGG
jgi:Trk K+ transport system NAD-binding subunit